MNRIHATSVAIGGRGVLIAGASGSGKSDLALRLIDRGAQLISDDYTDVSFDGCALIARAPAPIAGQLEVRGLGIVAFDRADAVPVALRVEAGTPERMPDPQSWAMGGVAVPTISLNLLESSAPLKVELALKALP